VRVRVPNPHRGDISVPLIRLILQISGIDQNDWENA